MIEEKIIIFFYFKKNRRWFTKKDNCRLLVPTLNKTNQNVSTIMGIIFSNNRGIVFRKVDTLTGGEKMRKEFEEASGKMKEALEKIERLLKKMEVEAMMAIRIGDEIVTKKQYKERVSFLLNEILEHGLLEHQKNLERLYDLIDGNKVYEIQCEIGDYLYLNK